MSLSLPRRAHGAAGEWCESVLRLRNEPRSGRFRHERASLLGARVRELRTQTGGRPSALPVAHVFLSVGRVLGALAPLDCLFPCSRRDDEAFSCSNRRAFHGLGAVDDVF